MIKRFKNKGFAAKAAIMILAASFLAVSCEDTTSTRDGYPPPVPSGVRTTTGNGVVWLSWDPIIGVSDLDGYFVYRSTDDEVYYREARITDGSSEYDDHDVVNGVTYYYGVSSFDYSGNESDVSFDYILVFDTPRPSGFDVVIYNYSDGVYGNISGFDFSEEERIPFDFNRTDIFLEYDDTPGIGTFFIHLGANGAGIQDMGYAESMYDITYAPDNGWSMLDYAEAIDGHIYVIRTVDNHFAMIRATDFFITPARGMLFDWAYQVDMGNRELKIVVPSDTRQAPVIADGSR